MNLNEVAEGGGGAKMSSKSRDSLSILFSISSCEFGTNVAPAGQPTTVARFLGLKLSSYGYCCTGPVRPLFAKERGQLKNNPVSQDSWVNFDTSMNVSTLADPAREKTQRTRNSSD